MTKKHFEVLAHFMAESHDDKLNSAQVISFCRMFNPNFDIDRFLKRVHDLRKQRERKA